MAQEAHLGLFAGDRIEYRFCNPAWRSVRAPIPLAKLEERARAIDPAQCRRLTFGGAPLDHPELAQLARRCRELGLSGLSLETDGKPLAAPGVIESLIEVGIETVFVVAGGIRRRVHQAVLRDDSLHESLSGIARLPRSGLPFYVVVPVLEWTADDLEPLLAYLLAMGARPTGLLLHVPEVRHVPAASRRALLPHSAVAKLAARVFAACARERVEYGFFRKRGVLPCAAGGALDRFGTVLVERLGVLRRGRDPDDVFERVEACATCSLAPSCPGADAEYVASFGAEGLHGIPLETSMDWRLKPIHGLEERGLKSVSAFENDVESNGRSLLRINGHCNMSCSFCFIDRTVPDLETEALRRSIDDLASRHLDHLVLSGGEPTLHPDLAALIAHAKSRGFRTVEIQSNGVKLAREEYLEELVAAGLDKITISLHSVDPEHSDKITRLPGAFAKTVRGIRNARARGVLTQVAHVIAKSNYRELPDTVRFLREQFPPGEAPLSICFGIAQPISDLVYTWVMPTFTEVKPYMRRALDDCLANGVGFGGMIGQGGYPPCMLDGELRYYETNLDNVYRSRGERDFHKAPRCTECSFDRFCLGVRQDYVETYGDDEIRPFRASTEALEGRARVRTVERRSEPAERLVQIRTRASRP